MLERLHTSDERPYKDRAIPPDVPARRWPQSMLRERVRRLDPMRQLQSTLVRLSTLGDARARSSCPSRSRTGSDFGPTDRLEVA
jgi:hypothetical protein